ncbi:SDR family NAD(P)-dependent oxidoreductase [Deinococcus yavapaiensis]|uniref:Short-subunit dehydrogenase n=1 Tax=Deinococcus yavapaiensis KR-236 TaxID=694435 RepID=A0A318S844_9DEIO|nr:SDR family NAD(P)-dependent oxidoreductase [Deinococcus yavapaiensis]PYE55187.1 short-subunit dehydrogenase [Deinococcus yavapaiensis KR-236]
MSTFARFLLSPPRCRDLTSLRRVVRGKTVLITGASFGIGEATAKLFGAAGAHVVLTARTQDRLREVARAVEAAGGRATVLPLDLSRPHDVDAFVETLLRLHPRVDVVISNAGKSIRRSALLARERRDLERSLAVNFTSPAALLLALLPSMIAAGGGRIVNVSTVSAKPPAAPRWASYQGSKAGFDVWLGSVAGEIEPLGVRVASVYLPLVRTRMSAASGLYDRLPALTPLDAAWVVAGAVVTPRRRVAPWWLGAQELVSLLLPGVVNAALSRAEAYERRREASGGSGKTP